MKLSCFVLSVFCLFHVFSQNQNNVWYFGDGNFLDFNANMATPVLTGNGPEIATATSTYCQEGSSTMCDATGNLLFYNNSENVFDRTYTLMPNGTGLIGSATTSAQTLIVPNPGNPNVYYIFHMDWANTAPNNGLYYSEVDMTLNGGFGDVTATKNVALASGPCSEQLKAVTHCNGQDVWVIGHSTTGNTYFCYLVTAAGVNTVPVVTNIGSSHPDAFSGMSYMTCTKDGSKIAMAGNMGGQPSVEVLSFDNLNGTFCNPQLLNVPDFSGGYGVEFSGDGSKLYVTGFQLHQYDFNAASWFSFPPPEIGGALMRGPNDKIYLVAGCDYYDQQAAQMFYARNIHVIENPNMAGAAANLQQNAYVTPRECGLGLPTCYYPTQTTNTCAPLNAQFIADNTTICENDCINITNQSSGAGIVSTVWNFPGGTPSTFNGVNPPQVCYPTQGTYTITVQITDCAGLTSNSTLDITVNDCSGPQPAFQASQTQICANDCIQFTDQSTGTNVNTWNWSFPGANPSTSTDQNPTNICYSTPGNYDVTLTVTDDLGTNTLTVPMYITVDACIPPVAEFTAPDVICAGECIDITDVSQNNPTQWNWTLPGGTPANSTDQHPQNICFLTPGIYTLELTASNAYGADTYTKDIEVLTTPNAGNDINLTWCETETVQDLAQFLDPATPTNGVWLNPQNVAGFNGSLFDPQISGAGQFTFGYMLQNGPCSDTAFFTIDVQNFPNAGIDGVLTICDNDAPVDLMNVLQGNPDANGAWTPPLNGGGSIFDPSADPSGVYTYTVALSPACGSDSSKANVTVNYVANVSIEPVADLCSTSPALDLQSNVQGGNWSGTGISDNQQGTFDPAMAGAGTHTITYTINIDNCSASATSDILITDVPTVDLGNDLVHCLSESIQLQVVTDPSNSIEWWNGSTEPFVQLNFDGQVPGEQFIAEVTVSNLCGDVSDQMIIELMDCDVYVYVPNAFTPDGNQHNPLFTPVITGEHISDYDLRIYNRWGEQVFTTNELTDGWDGTFNGIPVQDGLYTWKLKFSNDAKTQSEEQEYVGSVSIIR